MGILYLIMNNIKNLNINIRSKSDILLEGLKYFFWDNSNIEIMLSIINGQSNISLRILDWFVTNYSKKNKTKYMICNDDTTELFAVHAEYKSQLKAYNKKLFDPFCRRNRIEFKYNNNNLIITTIGQLNFFRWAIKNNVITYVDQNIHIIDNDIMNSKKNTFMLKKLKDNIIETSSDIDDIDDIYSSDKFSDNKKNIILSFS